MAWVLLDDDFPNHPKTAAVGRSAATVYVFGLCFCRKYFTGGFIPTHALPTIGARPQEVERLTTIYPPSTSPYWHKVDGGYQVHDYTYDDAGDKAKADTRKQQKREAGRLGGIRSGESRQAQREAEQQAQQNQDTKHITKHTASDSEAHRDGLVPGAGVLDAGIGSGSPHDDGFDGFWLVYPRKVAKKAAKAAWKRLNPGEALQHEIEAAIRRQLKSPQWLRDGGQYIPHPATWLNNARWQDEVQVGTTLTRRNQVTLGAVAKILAEEP